MHSTSGMQSDGILLPGGQALPHTNEARLFMLCYGAMPERPDVSVVNECVTVGVACAPPLHQI